MSIADADLARLIVAVILLLVFAHGMAHIFGRLHQPPVIGEIVGGLLLGPTLLGVLAPGVHDWVFPASGASATVLGAIYQIGLLLLMFCAGQEMRSLVRRDDVRTASLVATTGTLLPFIAGVALVPLLGAKQFMGTAHNETAFILVFGIALAVTSIPLISRILRDLKLLESRFARIILTVAVAEDVVLYVVLAVAVGIVANTGGAAFGLPDALGVESVLASSIYHTIAATTFLALALLVGPRVYRFLLETRTRLVGNANPIAFQLVWMLAGSALALVLGITPMYGAFLAGIIVASAGGVQATLARTAIAGFSFAFFIPIYFAVVGLKLDLVHHLDVGFLVLFIAIACVVKAGSVFLGAKLAGESPFRARALAIAMNARGGPGIVLASVSFDAGIIDEDLFVIFVLLAILTSLAAGSWLRTVRDRLRDPAPTPGTPVPEVVEA
jgi:Kef-type K+ transport system membrane component KefB